MKPQLSLPGSRARRLAQREPVALVAGLALMVYVPGLKLQSLNQTFRGTTRGARFAAAAKVRKQRDDVTLILRSRLGTVPPALPLVVTVTRVAPGTLDAHDNLPGACKHVVDALASWLGVDDRNEGITWRYDQRRDGREVGVAIRMEAP
jgi:hypothetical protein